VGFPEQKSTGGKDRPVAELVKQVKYERQLVCKDFEKEKEDATM